MTSKQTAPPPSTLQDGLRQAANLIAAPLIWLASSLGLFLDSARSPSEFSDLSENILVPETFAFSIWLPIFLGIFAYGVIQALRSNRSRVVFRVTGWWVAAGLWGIVAWGLATSYLSDSVVELAASVIFLPTMVVLVVAMVKLSRRYKSLDRMEHWLVLAPISLLAGWCSIAVFVGLNGLIWSWVEPLGWSAIGTAISVLSVALGWVIIVLRRGARNRIYALPVIWGLTFLALRHFGAGGAMLLGGVAVLGIVLVILGCVVKLRTQQSI